MNTLIRRSRSRRHCPFRFNIPQCPQLSSYSSGNRHYCMCTFHHAFLKNFVKSNNRSRVSHVFESVHLCPWVAEICNPRNSCGPGNFLRNEVHRVRWSRTDNCLNRIFFQVFFKEPCRWTNPEGFWIRNKHIAPDKERQLLPERNGFCTRPASVDKSGLKGFSPLPG